MTIAEAIKRWSSYLDQRQFIIRTNHQSFKYFLEQKVVSCPQQRWMSKLLVYDYVICYKKGKDNSAADSLSSKHEEALSNYIIHDDMDALKEEGMSLCQTRVQLVVSK